MENKEPNRSRPFLRGFCVLAVLAIVVAVTAWCLQVRDDRDAAVAAFNAASLALHDQNITLDKAMADLADAIDAGEVICDESLLRDARNCLANAQSAKQPEPTLPRRTADILAATDQMFPTVDYNDILQKLTYYQTALEACIAQEQQAPGASTSVF